MLRPHEIEGLPGAFYFLLGVFLSIAFFDIPISCLGILFLSVGDPFASICGIAFRSRNFMEGKSLTGTFGCGLVCSLSGVIYKKIYLESLNYELINQMDSFSFATLCFIVSILAEIGPNSRKHFIDDNLTIPLYSCILLTIFFKILYAWENKELSYQLKM